MPMTEQFRKIHEHSLKDLRDLVKINDGRIDLPIMLDFLAMHHHNIAQQSKDLLHMKTAVKMRDVYVQFANEERKKTNPDADGSDALDIIFIELLTEAKEGDIPSEVKEAILSLIGASGGPTPGCDCPSCTMKRSLAKSRNDGVAGAVPVSQTGDGI